MDVSMLKDIGLTQVQAVTYLALVQAGSATAAELAKSANESRTNAYKVLDKLCDLGLALKDTTGKKVLYHSVSPVSLEQLASQRTAAAQLNERKLRAAMPEMLNAYFSHSERPSIRYFQGSEGIE